MLDDVSKEREVWLVLVLVLVRVNMVNMSRPQISNTTWMGRE